MRRRMRKRPLIEPCDLHLVLGDAVLGTQLDQRSRELEELPTLLVGVYHCFGLMPRLRLPVALTFFLGPSTPLVLLRHDVQSTN